MLKYAKALAAPLFVAASNANVIYIAGQIGITDNGPNDFESQVDRS